MLMQAGRLSPGSGGFWPHSNHGLMKVMHCGDAASLPATPKDVKILIVAVEAFPHSTNFGALNTMLLAKSISSAQSHAKNAMESYCPWSLRGARCIPTL